MSKIHPIYHITHINNLPTILTDKVLRCDAERVKRGYNTANIAHEHLKQRRFTTAVPIGTKGFLADYAPFYFCNRSPMLCAISKGGVTGSENAQPNIIYFVSSVERVIKEGGRSWCFSDGHGIDKLTEFYDDPKELVNIDWGLIDAWDWRNTLADNDRVRKKQAEFLVYQSFPIAWVEKIAVYSEEQKKSVESTLAQHSYKIPVVIEKKWYYSTRGRT